MPDRRGRVYIAEQFDREDATYLAGRFVAVWQQGEDEKSERGPDQVTAEEAIAWGRRRAEVVLIRLGEGDYHSAGDLVDLKIHSDPLDRPRRGCRDTWSISPVVVAG